MMKNTAMSIFFALILFGAAVSLNALFKNNMISAKREGDAIQKVFGGLREFIGDWSLMKGEEYHHRGLPYIQALMYHEGESTLFSERSAVQAGLEEEEHHHRKRFALQNAYSRIYSSVKVTGDSHLAPSEDKEVVPWFYIAARFDPHNINAYVLGGYWLERIGKADEGLKFLKEGEENNPASPQIAGSIGYLYYRQSKLDLAVECLEKARLLWNKTDERDLISDRYMATDRLLNFDVLGYIYEKNKEYSKAAEVYKEIISFWPRNQVWADKIKKFSEQQNSSN